jgi:deoxycytidylate deaminase
MDYDELRELVPGVKMMIERCHYASKKSTCRTQQIGAVLDICNPSTFQVSSKSREASYSYESSPDLVFLGSNGSKAEPCIECTMDTSVPGLEYLTCPSMGAEGDVMTRAFNNTKDLRNAKLFTTGTPYDRLCKDLIIGFKIGEVYFNDQNNGVPNKQENIYIAQMALNGVKLFQLKDEELEEIVADSENLSAAKDKNIMPVESVEFWQNVFHDESYREALKKGLLKKKSANSQNL